MTPEDTLCFTFYSRSMISFRNSTIKKFLHQFRFGNQSINGVNNRRFFKSFVETGYFFLSISENSPRLKLFITLSVNTPLMRYDLKRRVLKLVSKSNIIVEFSEDCSEDDYFQIIRQMEMTRETFFGVKRLKSPKKPILSDSNLTL